MNFKTPTINDFTDPNYEWYVKGYCSIIDGRLTYIIKSVVSPAIVIEGIHSKELANYIVECVNSYKNRCKEIEKSKGELK